jgi:hypothetical protein
MRRVVRAFLPLFVFLVPLTSVASAKESGPPRLNCATAPKELRHATFHLEIGTAHLRNGKVCLRAGELCDWEVALTRAEKWGQNGQFLIAIVSADHRGGSGAWDSVFLYVCNEGLLTPVMTERSLYGIRVKLGSDNDLWMTTGVWRKDDPVCCASGELKRHLVWDASRSTFVVKDSSTRLLKTSKDR